ncbi:protein of unknown function [Pseudomonas mediterranea]
MWERACSRWRRHLQQACWLIRRHREQARSHMGLQGKTALSSKILVRQKNRFSKRRKNNVPLPIEKALLPT